MDMGSTRTPGIRIRIFRHVFWWWLNCAPDCLQGSKFKFSQIFWGEAHRAPSPDPSPLNLGLRLRFGLCSQLSSASCHRFGLRPKFAPPKFWPGCASETRQWHCQFQTFLMVIPQLTPIRLMRSVRGTMGGRGGYRAPTPLRQQACIDGA